MTVTAVAMAPARPPSAPPALLPAVTWPARAQHPEVAAGGECPGLGAPPAGGERRFFVPAVPGPCGAGEGPAAKGGVAAVEAAVSLSSGLRTGGGALRGRGGGSAEGRGGP